MDPSVAKDLPLPVVSGFDAVIQAIAALCYVAVGAAALGQAPRDIRTRVFAALSIVNVVAFVVPALAWLRGVRELTSLSRVEIGAILVSLALGALLLFHFTQVLPRRRPWLQRSGPQLPIAYVLAPAVLAGLVWFWPASIDDLSGGYVLALFIFGFPLLMLLSFVLPLAGILSLVKSYYETRAAGQTAVAGVIAWIVVSQIAGGTLALVFAPVLATIAPNSATQLAMTLLIWALGLITPLAFAVGIWKYGLLSVEA